MTFNETRLKGVFVIELEKRQDERGFFARTWCKNELDRKGLHSNLVQSSISFNHNRGTLRGMHYQTAPHEEVKLVRCTTGAIYDVVIDLRESSPTFMEWTAVELSAQNHLTLYIPENCAHGFQTLVDNTEVLYQMSEFYAPESARGVRWDDPAFGIQWPPAGRTISTRDATYPDFVNSSLIQGSH